MRRFFDLIETGLALAWQRIVASSTVREDALVRFRIGYGIFGLFFAIPSFAWISQTPAALFNPPILSIANLFGGFPPAWLLRTVDLVLPLLFLGITLGLRARICGLISVFLITLFSGFSYSFGKIDHTFLVWNSLLLLSLTNWGTQRAVIPDRPVATATQNRSLAVLAVCIAFGMVTAGAEKAHKWIDFNFDTSGFLNWFYNGYFSLNRQSLLAPLVLEMDPRLFEFADYLAVVFELSGFAFLLLGPRFWRGWLLFACYFHAVNALVLNITFLQNIMVYGVFLAPMVFCALSPQPKPTQSQTGLTLRLLAIFPIIFTLLHLIQRITIQKSTLLWLPSSIIPRDAYLYIASAIWIIFSGLVTLAFVRLAHRPHNS